MCVHYVPISRYTHMFVCVYIYIYIQKYTSWFMILISDSSPGIHRGDQWHREWGVCPGTTASKGARIEKTVCCGDQLLNTLNENWMLAEQLSAIFLNSLFCVPIKMAKTP